MSKPVEVRVRQTFVISHLTPKHQGLAPNFVAISEIKDKQKHSHPCPSCIWQRASREAKRRKGGLKRGILPQRGRRVLEFKPQQSCQKGRIKIKRADFRETISWVLNWVYVFTHPANSSVQGARPYPIHHTHTIKRMGMRRHFQLQLNSKVRVNLIHLPFKSSGLCRLGVIQIPAGKRGLS